MLGLNSRKIISNKKEGPLARPEVALDFFISCPPTGRVTA
jgi:hypothetical protein